jgi:hypothetical protein
VAAAGGLAMFCEQRTQVAEQADAAELEWLELAELAGDSCWYCTCILQHSLQH